MRIDKMHAASSREDDACLGLDHNTDGPDGMRERRRQLAWTLGWLSALFIGLSIVSVYRAQQNTFWYQSHVACCMQPFEAMRDVDDFVRLRIRSRFGPQQKIIYTFNTIPPGDLDVINAEIAKVRVCQLP